MYAGQQIPLTVTPAQNRVLASQQWTFCQSDASGNCTGGGQQDITGGFTGTNGGQPSAVNGGNEASDPDFTQSAVTFYFVNPGTTEKVSVTVTYTQDDGSQSTPVTSSAIFSIGGPTGNLLLTPNMITGTGSSDAGVGGLIARCGPIARRRDPLFHTSPLTPLLSLNQKKAEARHPAGLLLCQTNGIERA